ncbi:zeatin O-xylosyltransferase-like [Salvia miltiorrhiza]|uniref:zeatin O-xylosyltransferase-like n=1 Tax=Salvia miltiorrhiza TaxID=226208 RepID=UPI0025AC7C1F|nr:zeatin O-xylosyltransferase-like [Salvia miltiorrhiza]
MSNHHRQPTATKLAPVAVVAVPFPAQGHLNQMLQLSSLISSYGLPVYYAGSALHNRQAQVRINALHDVVAKIHFHDFPTPSFLSPPPNPNSTDKFPTQLLPAAEATLDLRRPFAAYLREMAGKFARVVVVHDAWMSFVVQDVAQIHNAESYEFVCISAFSSVSFISGFLGLPFPVPHPKELPPFQDWMSDAANKFSFLQSEPSNLRSGTIYNTSRLIEAPYLETLERAEVNKSRPIWAIGPVLPTSSSPNQKCLEWLDKQDPKSVIYVSFGTTVSLSDQQINELAHGLARSRVKFLWVLRDADKGDVFDGDVRRAELPEGFGERDGMVVREWAPQPQILAHPSVGGFMSHCGWNSCIESMTAGVAIAAWPMHSDQPRNAALIADVLKTGIVVREWKDRLKVVKASRIENVVRILMASEEGDQIRKTAEELGATMRRATETGGASRIELDSFIAHITR